MTSKNTSKFLAEEQQTITIARAFVYPVTPDVAGGVRERLRERPRPRPHAPRWRRVVAVAAALLLVLAGLMAVPQVRAAVLEWLQIGAIRIFITQPDATLEPLPTPVATPNLAQLGVQMTLAEAQAEADFIIRLPSVLGEPDGVYLRQVNGPETVSLLWFDAAAPEQIHAMLWQIGVPSFAAKWVYANQMQELSVNGTPAFGLTGTHPLQLLEDELYPPRLVTNTVLIWQENEMTYRLEGDFTLEEAVQIAESLE